MNWWDFQKPLKNKSDFNGNCNEDESKGDKYKKLLPKEYLDIIKPYLSDMIKDHKTSKKFKGLFK